MAHSETRGPLAWMAGNSIAANLLMAVFIIGGLICALRIKQEIFPDFDLDSVTVSVAYPQASPEEVERGIVQVIEERVQGLEDVEEVRSVANEGSGTVIIEMLEGGNIQKISDEVKSEVDSIVTFPEEAEEPRIRISSRERQVMSLLVHGRTGKQILKTVAENVRDGLLGRDDITRVDVTSVAPPETRVEIPIHTLRQYGITLDDVAQKIRTSALEIPGGTLETKGGDILLRVNERKYFADEFTEIPIITRPDGTEILLGDIATVKDTFEDIDWYAEYNGEPMVALEVFRVGDQTPISVSEAVREYIAEHQSDLPPGVSLSIWHDRSDIYRQRLSLLQRNAYLGLALVFILLSLFLETRLAFWVTLGIPISFLGAFLFLPMLGVSINMISMFAFIVSLGIVVDDAIVVGESIYEYHMEGYPFAKAAVLGVHSVAMPVVFSVLTNIAAFMPLLFVPGFMGKVFKFIPMVVSIVFAISLIESLFILPAHLAHQKDKKRRGIRGWLHGMQQSFSRKFMNGVRTLYTPFITHALSYRYVTIACGIALLISVLGYVKSGRMGMTTFPRIESDTAYASVTLPYGTAVEKVEQARDTLVRSAERVIEENGGTNLSQGIRAEVNQNKAEIRVMLTSPELRPISTREFTEQWRKYTGRLVGIETLSFASDRGGPGSGAALTIELSHRDHTILETAAAELAAALAFYSTVSDIDDGYTPGKKQFDVTMQPEGELVGFTAQSIARKLRNAFYGAEALRQQRGRDEVKVMVKLPEDERASAFDLETLIITTPGGAEVPLRSMVNIQEGRSYTQLNRRNGQRVLTVTADVTPTHQAGKIISDLEKETLPDLAHRYPGLHYSYEGRQAEMRDSLRTLFIGFGLAMFCVYALLAVPLKSYSMPLIIMVSIPFGIVGAVIGHLIMGYSLSIMSLMGVVALSGVVVNDSLVLMDLTNKNCRQGMNPFNAVVHAAVRRFRPIMLTTLTTFGGLAPMIMETSRQARFLIPMAISLGFGVVFATVITLCLVPCLFLIVRDLHTLFGTEMPAVESS